MPGRVLLLVTWLLLLVPADSLARAGGGSSGFRSPSFGGGGASRGFGRGYGGGLGGGRGIFFFGGGGGGLLLLIVIVIVVLFFISRARRARRF
jgi:uncharacterized membrane protein